MSSSTLTRTNSKNAKYKDYVSFLQSYKNSANDQSSDSGGNFSLTNSSNNSSSSVFSDNSDNQPRMKNKLQESLRNIKNQNSEVNRTLTKQPNTTKVKTEMVIQINNPPEKLQTHVFEVRKISNTNDHSEEPLLTVSHAAKIFENSEQKLNSNAHPVISKKNSIGEITKRFENSSISQSHNEQRTKSPIQKKNSINEVSKIFENDANRHHDNTNTRKFNNFNTTPKAFTPISQNGPKQTNTLVKPPITSPKPEIDPPHFFRTNLSVLHNNKASSSNSTASSLSSLSTSPSPPHSLSPTPPMMYSPPLRVASPPPLIVTSATPEPSMPNIPPPPPFEDINNRVIRTNENQRLPNYGSLVPPPPPIQNFTRVPINTANVPAPPPLPVQNLHQKSSVMTLPTKVSMQSNQTNDLVDGKNGTINKNDPRVKRAVYGALRNMYGAYHDQANDYIATLPKNRVKKNNKLDGIIESIALQGGLDKMTGRTNPNANKED